MLKVNKQKVIQQIQKRMLVSIGQVARKLGLKEGDYVSVEAAEDGTSLRIVPVDWHAKEQEYFWTEEWQEKVRRSLKDLEDGRFKVYDGMKDLLEEMENAADNQD